MNEKRTTGAIFDAEIPRCTYGSFSGAQTIAIRPDIQHAIPGWTVVSTAFFATYAYIPIVHISYPSLHILHMITRCARPSRCTSLMNLSTLPTEYLSQASHLPPPPPVALNASLAAFRLVLNSVSRNGDAMAEESKS